MKVYVINYLASRNGPTVFSSREKAVQWKLDNLDVEDREWYQIFECEVID